MTQQREDEQWSLNKFWSEFHDSDQDIVDNSLSGLLKYIKKISYFNDLEKGGDSFISSIITQVLTDNRYLNETSLRTIFDSTMQLIPQFAAKIPIEIIPILYNTIFTNLARPGIKFFTILSSVLEETILNGSNYSPERQQAIVNLMMNRLVTFINTDSTSTAMKNLSLNLIAATIETLPNWLTPSMISDLKNIIEKLSIELCERKDTETNEYLATTQSLSSVSKVYATLIDEKSQHEFYEYIEKLSNKRLSVFIFSTIIAYCPQQFDLSDEKDPKYSFVHYQELIFEQIANPQDVEEYSNAYAIFVDQCLKTLSILIDKFASKMTDDQINQYISTDFDFLNLGAQEQQVEAEADEDDAQIEVDDDDVSSDDNDNQVFESSDESWKIRVAAMKLGISLIEEKGDMYFDSLFYETDDCYMPIFVSNLIRDHDIGSKLEAMRFLRVIIRHYKNEIQPSVVEEWETSIISQINKDSRDQVLDTFIKTLTSVIRDLQQAPSLEITEKAIKNISEVYRDNTIDATLLFITNILEYSSEVKIVQPLIKLINVLLSGVKSHTMTSCLTVISKIYHYYHRKCNNDKTLHKELDALNEQVLGLSTKSGEVRPYAITTISVFVSCCPGLSTVQKSVDKIVGFLDESAVAKVSIGAIALISASESAKTLSKDTKLILSKLKTKIMSEPSVTNRSLWAIRIMLHKNILSPNDCQDIIGTLFDIANNGEKNARVLSLKIINHIYPKGCDSNRLCSLVDSLTSSPLSERIIGEVAELVLTSSKASLDNVKSFVDSLIDKIKTKSLGKDESASLLIISNAALIVGVASSTNKDYGLSLISKFKEHINDKGNLQVFSLRCIGEIGSLVDLSSTNNDLVESIFKLVHDSDRSVFVPASESIGLMSVGSPGSILKKFINSAKADGESYLTAYLFGIKSFVKKANKYKNHIPKEVYSQIVQSIPEISDFLLANSKDDFKETALTVSECLAGLVGISFEYSQTLIKSASYITIRALSIYMEEYSTYGYKRNLSKQEKDEVMQIITKVNEKYDNEKPMLDFSIMLCIKFAITKNLAQELFKAELVERCLLGTEIQQSHNVIKTIGTEQVPINIGTQLKSTSLSCLELLLKSDIADQLDYDDLSTTVLTSFSSETLFELRQKALDIMTLIAISPLPDAQDNAIAEINQLTTIDFLKRFDNVISNENPPSEVKVSYYTTLVSLLSVKTLTQDDTRKIKSILARHQNDPILKRIEEENQFRGSGTSDSVFFTNGYTSSRLMEELYPEAASIFFN